MVSCDALYEYSVKHYVSIQRVEAIYNLYINI